MRKKIKKMHTCKFMILITSIIMVNFIGVSYAYWNEESGVKAQMSATIGNMDLQFCKIYAVDKIDGNGNLTAYFEDDYTMVITGEIEPGYKGSLHYCINNNGSVPVKYNKDSDDEINDGLSIEIKQPGGVINPNREIYNENGNPRIDIIANDVGEYDDFEIDMFFDQWIKN